MIIETKLARRVLLSLMLILAPTGASARATFSTLHEERISTCIREASGGHAWLEKTLWGLRDQEGGWIGAEIANSNGTYDLGPLQINSNWVPKLAGITRRSEQDVRRWLASDPCFNVRAARWIFLSGLALTRDYWGAVGLYHSPTPWRQHRYAAAVSHHLRRRFGDDVFLARRSAQP